MLNAKLSGGRRVAGDALRRTEQPHKRVMLMAEKVCECIEQLRMVISHSSDGIMFGMRHDFETAKEHVRAVRDNLRALEICTEVPVPFGFEETRIELDKADKALEEFKDVEAEEYLKLAQWSIFREVREKVCK